MSRVSTGTSRARVAALALGVAASLLLSCALWRETRPPEPTAGSSAPVVAPAEPPPTAAPPAAEGSSLGAAAAAPVETPESAKPPAPPENGAAAGIFAPSGEGAVAPAAPAAPETGTAKAVAAPAPRGKSGEAATKAAPEAPRAPVGSAASPTREAQSWRVAVAKLPDQLAFDQSGPWWTRGREELVYRVEFLGTTMGYARFVFNGKVLLGGREVYHLSVRAWTANILALVYPINDTIDYYMDVKTLEPLRQEYTSGNRKKDDVMIYDQATGRIVYRYKESGEIRKEVNAIPNVYDPVTLAYFIRSRGAAGDEQGRNVYAGRKVWEISAQPLGAEKLATPRGEVETIVIRPVIKRDGKVENKGDLRMWLTRDERRTPVRLYAKFKKIWNWTLVGELMPERKGG